MPQRVCVIGGGALGLTALKNLKDDDFQVTLYEGRGWVGGLWKYSKDDGLSAGENTAFNTSRFRASFSDFPMPDGTDDFPSAVQIYKYLNAYCDHFQLWPHIQLNTKILEIKRDDQTWAVVMASKTGTPQTEYFDKIAVATGSFSLPKTPELDGIELFAGKAIHSQQFHDPSQYAGKNVLIVGMHATAQDVASALATHASKVFLAHRSGLVFMSRYATDGSVFDRQPSIALAIFMLYLASYFPSRFIMMMDSLTRKISRQAYPNMPASWNLDNAPSVAVSPPLIATLIYPHLESGKCEPVPPVRRITSPDTIELESGRLLSNIDTIIYCTGYHHSIPLTFTPSSLNPYPIIGKPPNLFRNIFPLDPDPSIRSSLAFLGQGAVPYPGFLQFECQAMCISQIWLGNSSLPSLPEMQRWKTRNLAWRSHLTKQYSATTTFYQGFLPLEDQIPWLDSVAGLGIRSHFGWIERWTNWGAWKFWWKERELYHLVLKGFPSPAICRLFETGKRTAWKGAREQIRRDNELVEEQRKGRVESLRQEQAKEGEGA